MPERSLYVVEAARWASVLVAALRSEGYDDPVGQMARDLRVSRHAIWALLYRKPKMVGADVFVALGIKYEQHRADVIRRYEQERAETNPKTRLGAFLLRISDTVVGKDSGTVRED